MPLAFVDFGGSEGTNDEDVSVEDDGHLPLEEYLDGVDESAPTSEPDSRETLLDTTRDLDLVDVRRDE